jgi:filamentous hemagglutinin family protein
VIWNRVSGVCQAVSETAKGHIPQTLGSRAFAQALPAGESVVADSGTITQAGKTLTLTQSTDKLAADWQNFNVGAGHSVNFVLPSASSVALYRVLGTDVSVIQGAINANGQVFLVNPNGILFTPTAQVNVGRLVASTLNISNADFIAGKYSFEGADLGSVTNEGAINANGGTVALIAAKIINSGSVTADRGNVLMGAGEKVTLDLGGTVKLRVTQGVIDALRHAMAARFGPMAVWCI